MQKHRALRLQLVQEKLQDSYRIVDLQIERAIHKLEVTRPALVKRLKRRQHPVQIKPPSSLVQRTQAKLAFERAAA